MHAANPNTTDNTCTAVLEEDTLPSYEEAVGTSDTRKLPSYRRSFSARYHPYKRPSLRSVDERDRLMNTIFDDEYVPFDVPTPSRRGQPGHLYIHEAEATQRLLSDVERVIQFELRVERLDATIIDFIERLGRAPTPQ